MRIARWCLADDDGLTTKRLVTQAIAIAVTAVGMFRLFQNWPHIWDVGLWDETGYLRAGLLNAASLMLNYEAFGLYGKFYHVMALLVGNAAPVQVYMLGGLVSILLGLAGIGLGVWAASRNLGIAIAAVSWLSLSAAVDIWPRVTFLCMFILGAGLSASALLKSPFAKASVIALACFLAAFVRAEYVVSFYLAAGLAICCAIAAVVVKADIERREIAIGLAAIGAIVWLSFAWSFPVLEGGGRSFMAFGQHYALRTVADRHLGINPWDNWQQIVTADFPGATSMADALMMHPHLVLGFFAENLFDAPANLWQRFTPPYHQAWPLYWTLALALPVTAWRCRAAGWRLRLGKTAVADVTLAAVLFLPPALSMVLVYPRDHYLLLGVATGLFVVASLVRGVPTGSSALAIAISAAFALSVRPLPVVAQPTVSTIEKIRSAAPVTRMVEMDGGWCTYMVPVCESYFPYEWRASNFGSFIRDAQIDAVMVSPRLKALVVVKMDPSFEEFIDTAEQQGWTRHDMGDGSYMLVRPRSRAVTPPAP